MKFHGMKAPVLRGTIARRILVGLRVDPDVIRGHLPAGIEPRLMNGAAIAGVAFTRLEGLRTRFLPIPCGLSSDSVVHRVAVKPSVRLRGSRDRENAAPFFVARRDASSVADAFISQRSKPAERGRSRVDIAEEDGRIEALVRSFDGKMEIRVLAEEVESWPADSVFDSLLAAVRFFGDDNPSAQHSATPRARRSRHGETESGSARSEDLQDATTDSASRGIPRPALATGRRASLRWVAHPLDVKRLQSTYLDDSEAFPPGSFTVDHALCLRNVEEVWHCAPDLHGGRLFC